MSAHRHFHRCIALVALLGFVACDDDVPDTPTDSGTTGGMDMLTDSLPPPPILDMRINDAAPDAGEERCDGPEDCASGYCVPTPEGDRVCTDRCADDNECPDGWQCRAVLNAGADTVFICVAARRVQCDTCVTDSDCGAGDGECITIGQGDYCAQNCETLACPAGHSCEDVEVDGEARPLCLPDAGACRPCADADGDGYGVGE